MAQLRNRPLFTDECDPTSLTVRPGSVYLYGKSGEQRSEHVDELSQRSSDVLFVEIDQTGTFAARATVVGADTGKSWDLLLRSRTALANFLSDFAASEIVIDITGLAHNVWAPLTKVALEEHTTVRAVYVEPMTYAYSSSPRQGDIFDLSEHADGIGPIPLFASLADTSRNSCFIPLLGFEGARFAYLVEMLQPADEVIFPIIGVPGFRAEYPFHAYLANSLVLERTRSYRNICYAKSNCPFSLIYAVRDVVAALPDHHIKLGLAGTKPHALGAVLMAVAGDRSIELVYDQRRRKPNRTSGAARCLTYHLSDFLPEAGQRRQQSTIG